MLLRNCAEKVLSRPEKQKIIGLTTALLVVCFQLIGTGVAHGQDKTFEQLLEQLRSDDIPGNASRALQKLDPRFGVAKRETLVEHIDELKALTDDPDPQIKQYASYLLAIADPTLLDKDFSLHTLLWKTFTEGLSGDDTPFNAGNSHSMFWGAIRESNPEYVRDMLTPLLGSPDYQARQLATYLIVMSYRQAKISEEEWNPLVFENMVAGLADDEISCAGGTISNGFYFFQYLYELERNQPIKLVRAALASEDSQSRFIASMLLACWKDMESRQEIRSLLLPALNDDDGWYANYALPSYQAMVWYGREHTNDLLKTYEPADWQAAALIVCVAAFHDVSPTFVTDTHRKAWIAQIEEFEDNPPTGRSETEYNEAKIAAAALYLDPGAPTFLEGINEIPQYLQRMLMAGDLVEPVEARAKWMISWFPMLDPFDVRVLSILDTGLSIR